MEIHYIWIGNNNIPKKYISNYQKCVDLNKGFKFNIWQTEECLKLIEYYDLGNVFSSLSFIGKCNLLKYVILQKHGGIYTDFDITWKQSFSKIMYDFNFPDVDVVLTSTNENTLMDDPFIISKPNIFGGCVSYCKNRTNLKYDGELYKKTKELKVHILEPFGPFGLTEWLHNRNISYSCFPQETLLDNNGFLGIHEQKSTWKF
jgi:hypothetical protein